MSSPFRLEKLELANNSFGGELPKNLSHFHSLSWLLVYGNHLKGKIPAELGTLPKLTKLYLGNNHFSGKIPPWIGNVSTLTELSLPTNDLHGDIPFELGRLPNLSILHLSDNHLSGSIPNTLFNVSSIVILAAVQTCSSHYQKLCVLRIFLSASKVMAECEALRNIRHRNLVKTITSCSSTDFAGTEFKALVFEFMPNGSLEKWLHPYETGEGTSTTPRLSLLERLNIAIDIAAALNYLHHRCHTPIIHCELKSSNVLLDSDMSAHLSDFGLAKFLIAKISQSHSQTSSIGIIRGTLGYIAPEYGFGGEVSTRGDVYSFGILLLEMFTGKRPTDSMFTDNFGLREYVAKAASDEEGLSQVVDPALLHWEEEANPRRYKAMFYKCLAVVLRLGISCSAALSTARIDIGGAVLELHKARDTYLKNYKDTFSY